jgi:hypothetical protein
MAHHGASSFKKRQKEQQRKEKRQEKLARRLQRRSGQAPSTPESAGQGPEEGGAALSEDATVEPQAGIGGANG